MTQVLEIPIGQVDTHKLNPRRNVGDVSELAASIKEVGVLEPVLVVRNNGGYEVVAGTRRLAAAQHAGLKTIPAIEIGQVNGAPGLFDAELAAIALIENLQRTDLDALEEAQGYRSWLELTKRTQADLARAIGKAPSTIANALRLLEAAAPIQAALREKRITAAHARVAMALPADAVPLLELKKDMSVKDLQDEVREVGREFTVVERIRARIKKAEDDGDTVTWSTDGRAHWIGGVDVDLGRALGKPKHALAGIIAGWIQLDGHGAYGANGSQHIHDEACDCRAYAVAGDGDLVRGCISPAGWKKYKTALAKTTKTRRGAVKKRVVTAVEKEAKRKRDLKVNTAEATKALAGKAMGYGQLQLNQPANLLAGGLNGEPARIALFGLVSKASHNARGNAWRVELWKQIEALPLKDIRERVTRWAVALGIRELNDDYKNAGTIRRLVTARYGSAKKKARR